MKLNHTCSVTR